MTHSTFVKVKPKVVWQEEEPSFRPLSETGRVLAGKPCHSGTLKRVERKSTEIRPKDWLQQIFTPLSIETTYMTPIVMRI